jgi:hypothetical protein
MPSIPGSRPAAAILFTFGALTACSDFATEPDRYPASLRVTPDTVYLVEGEEVTFTLDVLDQDGVPYDGLPAWAPPIWTSATPERLEVDGGGTGHAHGPGETWTRVEVAGLTARSLVRANPVTLGLDVAFVYVTQSVQREDGAVPLIAGRDGLLRVYLSGSSPNFFRPEVHATFYRDGAVVHAAVLTFEHVGIPEDVYEGDLRLSYDAMVPGSVFEPGLSVVVEVDPGGVVPAEAGSTMRVPATGELPLEVVEVPPFRLRLVPVTQHLTGQESGFTTATASGIVRLAGDVFPFAEFDVDVREPYTTMVDLRSEGGWYELIEEIAFLRLDDGSSRYYYGGFQLPPGNRFLGLGYVGYPVAIGVDDRDGTVAHEIGHTLGLPHAPCGDPAGVDLGYPYENGSVGRFGYDRTRNALLDPDDTYDLMSYCDPIWISDYNYRRVVAYRGPGDRVVACTGAAYVGHAGRSRRGPAAIGAGTGVDGATGSARGWRQVHAGRIRSGGRTSLPAATRAPTAGPRLRLDVPCVAAGRAGPYRQAPSTAPDRAGGGHRAGADRRIDGRSSDARAGPGSRRTGTAGPGGADGAVEPGRVSAGRGPGPGDGIHRGHVEDRSRAAAGQVTG